MNLIVFVVHISNPHQLSQRNIYEKYLIYFDVMDAIMCNNGECLAACIGVLNTDTTLPVCFESFEASTFNDGVCQLKILETDCYEQAETIQTKIYNIAESYDKLQFTI
ncbi:hypothetical protein [Orgyia leucostigma nucleopolyhedrovirus]|uniref:Uncharacterized protein n=1 Tax=Orgyia leucostigma nucleopolyhedrovirus TaxID=490711 RepID=B0FDX6_9ABAC|nr:hypothetical protein [Orgyia leucostigma nucleopolyhedrovirus]ABY65834.1 hypothetical protein [Orgyia leucostigma nucleopolyhedrovirus]